MAIDFGGVRGLYCLDCDESTRYISSDGDAYFRLTHAGHRVVQRDPAGEEGPSPGVEAGAVVVPQAGNAPGSHAPRGPTKSPGSFESMFSRVQPVIEPEHHEALPEPPEEGARRRRKAEGEEPRQGKEKPARPEAPSRARQGTSPPPPRREGPGEKREETTPQAVSGGELLMARTTYIEDTAEAQMEVRRVSKALKEFRWNVTPPYTISMLFSDILCITSESASIAKELIDKIEELGYSFSGFEANNSRPLAWFKRKEEQEPPAAPPQEPQPPAEDPKLQELVRTIQDQGAMLEKEMARLEEERKKIADELKTLPPTADSGQQ